MSITITAESKNDLTITNETKKGGDVTWDEAIWTWDDAEGTWDNPGTVIVKESKNTLTISNENKL